MADSFCAVFFFPWNLNVNPILKYFLASIKRYILYIRDYIQGGYVYLRTGNPTCQEAECVLKNLECGAGSLTFSSGMAAITTAISTVVQNGDHVVRCLFGLNIFLLKL